LLGLSRREIERRVQQVLSELERKKLDALYVASPTNIVYLTGFYHIPTERPLATVILSSGERILIVPKLEEDHARRYAYVDRVLSYGEYPDEKHPMFIIADYLKQLGLEGKRIGYDSDGHPHIHGYRGPRLSEVFKASYSYERDLIERMRMRKSEEEIALIKESAKWCSLGLRLLQKYVRPGLFEEEIALKATLEATAAMARTLSGIYIPGRYSAGTQAYFRGQVGKHSFYPHSLPMFSIVRRGDVLIGEAFAPVNGYSAELERTLIVGRPTPEQEKFFKLMMEARKLAFESIRAGVRCADVDRAVRRFFKERGLMEYWRHHTGHGIGLEGHEAPFFDVGDDTVLEEGMVMSVEPGIYVEGLGGFRHSDTIVVTRDGYEILTKYPDELEDMVIDV